MPPTDKTTENGNSSLEIGWFIRLAGWAICAGSVFFALGNKSADPPYVIPFWFCFATLVGVSVFYFFAKRIFVQWKSKDFRSYFSPYIVGATIWLLLILLFAVLDRVTG